MCQKLASFEFDKNLNWCVNTSALGNILHFNENLKTIERNRYSKITIIQKIEIFENYDF